jgi:hypothetical protein
VKPRNNWQILLTGLSPGRDLFEGQFEVRFQPPSCSSEVLVARNEGLMALQDSGIPSRAIPSTLVHLDPECRPRPPSGYSGDSLCDSRFSRTALTRPPSPCGPTSAPQPFGHACLHPPAKHHLSEMRASGVRGPFIWREQFVAGNSVGSINDD